MHRLQNNNKFEQFTLVGTEKYNESEIGIITGKILPTITPHKIIYLFGDLGAGKTTFSKYLIRKILNNPNIVISSPTFNIVHEYDIDNSKYKLYHIDLYRIKRIEEVYEIGIMDFIDNSICIIEWPEIIMQSIQKNALAISIEFSDSPTERKMTIYQKENLPKNVERK